MFQAPDRPLNDLTLYIKEHRDSYGLAGKTTDGITALMVFPGDVQMGKDATKAEGVFEQIPLDPVLHARLTFLYEIEALKTVGRQTLLFNGSRLENDAEHTWEVAMMAVVLAEYAPPGTDMDRVVRMLLVHDLVEVYAGDSYAYDPVGNRDQERRENLAAERLFDLLPASQADNLHGLWEEFEERRTPEAQFARALDRLQPLLHNFQTKGRMWSVHGVTAEMVAERVAPIGDASTKLGELADAIIAEATHLGYFPS